MFKSIISISQSIMLLIALLCTLSTASTSPNESLSRSGYTIEVDPIAYFLKGYSVHLIVDHQKWRYDLGVFGLELPDAAYKVKPTTNGSKLRFDGLGFKVDYFLNSLIFIGAQSGAVYLPSPKGEAWNLETSLRVGLKWKPWTESFYIQPWLSYGPSFGEKAFGKDDQRVELKSGLPFATVHLGWEF
jgi:hypothetical protein